MNNVIFVLIIIIQGWYQSGVAVTTQEFTSREACYTAGQMIQKASNQAHEIHAYCVEK